MYAKYNVWERHLITLPQGCVGKVKVIEARPVFVFETASHQSSSCLPFGTQSE